MSEALAFARQIADALHAANKLGIVHRDMKPANIMLVPAEATASVGFRAVITDFGLARLDPVLSQGNLSALSHTARPIGTLAYMAPEQLEGTAVSPATDIYAFGLILFEMVTGTRAFPSENFLSGIAQRLTGTLPGQDQVFELAVSDASGEAFKRIFETRHCSREFEDLATESRELLLFLHPKQAVPPQRIDLEVDKLSDDLDNLLDMMAGVPNSATEATAGVGVGEAASGGDTQPAATEETQTPSEILEWDAKCSAYQTKLVDLLQIASRLRCAKPARLAIVISAWDRCEKEKLQPEAWIKARLPLLYQYMVANADVCEFAVFGVSAQGAELKNPGVLLDTIRASDRIKVVHGANESKDLTLPINFLLEDAAKDSAK